MSDPLAIATTSWGVVMALAPLLQIRVILRERDASGTSIGWLLILLVGFVLWLAYGLANGVGPVIITNVVALSVGVPLVGIALAYRRRPAAEPGD